MILYRKTRILSTVLIILLVGVSALSSCKKEIYLSQDEVQARLQKDLPPGSSIEQVKSFIRAYQSNFQVTIDDYRQEIPEPSLSDAPENKLPNAQGYLGATIFRTGINPEIFAHYNIRLVIYFDQNKLLVGHKIYTVGAH
jgi:hypothetical protein